MIYNYLLEIKYRVVFSFITWCFLAINCYFFKETLLYIFIKLNSVHHSNFIDYFLITNVTEVFITYLQLVYFLTNRITTIFICYQCFVFFSTGFYKFEYVYFKNVSLTILISWGWFFYIFNFIIFPTSWDFFLKFQSLTFYFEAKLNEYWAFYLSIYNISFFSYQLTIFFLISLNLFNINFLVIKKLRKSLYFFFFFAATIVTPPDVIYQLITGICMILIYEIVILRRFVTIEFVSFRQVVS